MEGKSSFSDIDARIAKLQERKQAVITKSANRFARAAAVSGLAAMGIDDKEIERMFEEIALRLREEKKDGRMALHLHRIDQQLSALERRRRILMTSNGKRVARSKTLLGGIVVRAGLTTADRAFLLGGLLELAKIEAGSPEHCRLRDIGAQAFKMQPAANSPRQIVTD